MKILIYGINYTPELVGIGKYTGEMAEWLVSRRHKVRIITAYPYYPEWEVAPNYKSWKYKYEQNNNIEVFRCPLWVPQSLTGFKRIIHLLSFAFSSAPVLMKQLDWKPAVMISIQPTFFILPLSVLFSKLSEVKSVLHIQDFEIDAAFNLGLLQMDFLLKIIKKLENWIIKKFDLISSISPKMLERLPFNKSEKSRSILFPNWVDTNLVKPLDIPSKFRKQLKFDEHTTLVLYSGNIGEKHGIETIIQAAQQLIGSPNIQFVLCGRGAAYSRIKKLSEGLNNIHWLPLQPLNCFNDLMNLADIHLLPQRAGAADLVMPSKLTGMLASGRPIVATAHQDTQIAEVVKECGIVVPPGDLMAFMEAIKKLSKDTALLRKLGKRAREYAVIHFDRKKILEQFEGKLKLLVNVGYNTTVPL